MTDLTIKQRHLPHFNLDGGTYFITWRLFREQKSLTDAVKDIIVSALRFFDGSRYELLALVVMDDHVHVLLRPIGEWKLAKILHSWKSFTAHELIKVCHRSGSVWQHESYDHLIRNEIDLNEKLGYITTNPMRKWSGISNYQWVWSVFDA